MQNGMRSAGMTRAESETKSEISERSAEIRDVREVNNIVIHCTATPIRTSVESIVRYWRDNLGWRNPGYHFIVEYDGTIHQLQPIEKPSNGVRGHNADSIHISYIGGVDGSEPEDTRSQMQYRAMEGLVKALHAVYPNAEIKGHRDFPGVNKACPSFSVSEWVQELQITKFN